MSYLTVLIAVVEALMLVITRAHWIIDFTTAIACAFILHPLGEKLSYFADVKGFGYPKLTRSSFHYTPCAKCGAATSKPELHLRRREL